MSSVKELLHGSATPRSKKRDTLSSKVEEINADRPTTFDIEWLSTFLDEAQERDQPLWKPPTKQFRGSASGSLCERDLTFNAMGHNVPFEARVLRIFRTGKKIEEEIVETAKAAKVFVKDSDQLEGWHHDPDISNHVDMIVEHPVTEERFLVEIKSINTHQFKKLPKEHAPIPAGQSPLYGTHRGYVTQWNTYAWTPEVDLKYGCILFEDKNDQHQKYYWLERDEDLMAQTLEVHRRAAEFLEGDEPVLAPIPAGYDPKAGDGDCRRCSHRYLCKRLDSGTVSYEDVRKEDAKLRG